MRNKRELDGMFDAEDIAEIDKVFRENNLQDIEFKKRPNGKYTLNINTVAKNIPIVDKIINKFILEKIKEN